MNKDDAVVAGNVACLCLFLSARHTARERPLIAKATSEEICQGTKTKAKAKPSGKTPRQGFDGYKGNKGKKRPRKQRRLKRKNER